MQRDSHKQINSTHYVIEQSLGAGGGGEGGERNTFFVNIVCYYYDVAVVDSVAKDAQQHHFGSRGGGEKVNDPIQNNWIYLAANYYYFYLSPLVSRLLAGAISLFTSIGYLFGR